MSSRRWSVRVCCVYETERIWMCTGVEAEAWILSDWGAYENIGPELGTNLYLSSVSSGGWWSNIQGATPLPLQETQKYDICVQWFYAGSTLVSRFVAGCWVSKVRSMLPLWSVPHLLCSLWLRPFLLWTKNIPNNEGSSYSTANIRMKLCVHVAWESCLDVRPPLASAQRQTGVLRWKDWMCKESWSNCYFERTSLLRCVQISAVEVKRTKGQMLNSHLTARFVQTTKWLYRLWGVKSVPGSIYQPSEHYVFLFFINNMINVYICCAKLDSWWFCGSFFFFFFVSFKVEALV